MGLGGIRTQVINTSLQHFILAAIPRKRIPHSVRTPDTDWWPFYLLTVIIRKPHHLPTAGSLFFFIFFWIGTRMAPSLVSDSKASLGEQVWVLLDGNNDTPYGALVSSRLDVRGVTCRHFVGVERCRATIWTPVPSSPLQSPTIRSSESPTPPTTTTTNSCEATPHHKTGTSIQRLNSKRIYLGISQVCGIEKQRLLFPWTN